jgi:4-amino-4-deoxy-L-arabinose transferase-like glycosyltransferase
LGTLSGISRALSGLGARPRLLLVLILALGFALRAIQTHLGLPYVYNFDDPQVAAHALGILKTGDWNPHFFSYGSLMIYIDTVVDAANYLRLASQPIGARESLIAFDQLTMIDRIMAPAEGSPVWYWTISHPSFYLWDRYVTALFGAGTIAVTYAFARRILPSPMALVPPLLLAVVPIHIVESGFTTTDIPAGFMVGVATLAAMVFAETGGLTAFITSLVFVGLAAATKYNSGLILISPLLALLMRRNARQPAILWWHWLLLIAVPAVTFLTVMPFALLDFKRFITDLAQSTASYHAPGPSQARPGIRHLRLIFTQLEENLGIATALLALIGGALMAAAGRVRPALILLLAFPAVFILYISTTTTDHHRNFMQLYPFLCLYAGYGLFRLTQWRLFTSRLAPPARALAALLIAAVATLPLLYGSVTNAAGVLRSRDTRTLAVTQADALDGVSRFEVAAELHIHQFDLDRLTKPYDQRNMQQIMGEICGAAGGTAFIVPTEMLYTDFMPATPEENDRIARVNALMRTLKRHPDTVTIGDAATPTWRPLVNPGILIVRARNGSCDKDR